MAFYMRYCPHVPFLMKVDDDVAVHLDRLLDLWQMTKEATNNLFCSILNNTEPVRDPSSKWYASETKWPLAFYPLYCNGPFYIMGKEAARRMLSHSLRFPLFTMEDVFYTGLVAGSLGIKVVDWRDRILNHLEVIGFFSNQSKMVLLPRYHQLIGFYLLHKVGQVYCKYKLTFKYNKLNFNN
ncbi:unnamed protein product [Strongylus vulgaris]|uniref:Hexosyltransferase n=1 Tax=Strongylus vulgaris TaxID=40348 RepID=A0A3P7K1R4_STRVU|nr:unnamed protein product [Strongylus vulgaris]